MNTELIEIIRDLLVDIDAFDKGGAFKKLRSYQRARELTEYVPLGLGQIDRTGALEGPCAKCDPERWQTCETQGCERIRTTDSAAEDAE